MDDPYRYCDPQREKEMLYHPDHMATALDMAKTGKLRCVIDDVMPLERLHDAYDLIGENKVTGKLVIDPTLKP